MSANASCASSGKELVSETFQDEIFQIHYRLDFSISQCRELIA